MSYLLVLETVVSFSSSAYIVNETSGQISVVITSSNISSTRFAVELQITQDTATGKSI